MKPHQAPSTTIGTVEQRLDPLGLEERGARTPGAPRRQPVKTRSEPTTALEATEPDIGEEDLLHQLVARAAASIPCGDPLEAPGSSTTRPSESAPVLEEVGAARTDGQRRVARAAPGAAVVQSGLGEQLRRGHG